MTSVPPATSPQFRVALIRKLGNMIPDCTVEFVKDEREGVAFRLKDSRGRYRSNLVHIQRSWPRILDATSLAQILRRGGTPPAGLPKGLQLRSWT
jgi:hypothetical protein